MKLYKFRSLNNEKSFGYAKDIITTGNFYCSIFSNFNDPMEGVFLEDFLYKTEDERRIGVKEIYDEKQSYKICSFSGEKGFKNPAMWGYYTNIFRGIVIELEIDPLSEQYQYIQSVKYINKSKKIKKFVESEIKYILTSKSIAWKHENEFRFLKKQTSCYCKIGNVSAVYFGNPYLTIKNKQDVLNGNENLNKNIQEYSKFKENLISLLKKEKIKYYDVCIKDGKIEICG